MFNKATITPAWSEFRSGASIPEHTRRENTDERVRFSGPGLELIRRVQVEQLRGHMEVFYEHATAGDLFALCSAFELVERGWKEEAVSERQQAALVESFLAILGLDPKELLSSDLQKNPTWPL